jgi:hypothetical protein
LSESAVVRRRTAVLIAFACLAAGCGATEVEAKPAAAKQSPKSAVRKVVKQYLAAVAAGDGEAACTFLTDETVAAVVDDGKTRTADESLELCADTISTLSELLEPGERKQLNRPKFTSVKVTGRSATVRVAFIDDKVKLTYTDDHGWLIADAVS